MNALTVTPTKQPQLHMLETILIRLSKEGCPCLILHGATELNHGIESDVDLLAPADWLPLQIARTFDEAGFILIQHLQHESTAHYFVLTDTLDSFPNNFLVVDVSSDYRRDGRVYYTYSEMAASSRTASGWKAPSVAQEFACYLIKRVAKRSLTEDSAASLSQFFGEAPDECATEISRFWPLASTSLLIEAASSGKWDPVQKSLPRLRSELMAGNKQHHRSGYWRSELARRYRRILSPTGLFIVILGPDGAGKSTVAELAAKRVAPAFRKTRSIHFGPGMFRRRGDIKPVMQPHLKPPRGRLTSNVKAMSWLADYTFGYFLRIRFATVKSTFVISDRYLQDVAIDPARYRYGGSTRLLRLIERIAPKPDLIFVLDAPTEIVQQRKQEVSAEESERQRRAYLKFAQNTSNARVLDASRDPEVVASQAAREILEFMAERTRHRLELGR